MAEMVRENRQLPQSEGQFGIIEEYVTLASNRKVLLCDYLFLEDLERFEKLVQTIWPQADQQDIRKLENFLKLIRVSSH